MADIGASGNGTPTDPAQIYAFLAVAGTILHDDKPQGRLSR